MNFVQKEGIVKGQPRQTGLNMVKFKDCNGTHTRNCCGFRFHGYMYNKTIESHTHNTAVMMFYKILYFCTNVFLLLVPVY